MPYLRMFDPAEGSVEHVLAGNSVTIGRSAEGSDIRLEHASVSRAHAVLCKSGEGYVLQDAGSSGGTLVNGEIVREVPLSHGDVIQISHYVIEYRTDDDAREKRLQRDTDSAVDRNIRMRFRLSPQGLTLRFRTIDVEPGSVFSSGDTLPVGGGGILLPVRHPPEAGSCLEVEFTWPNGKSRRIMGEVIYVLDTDDGPAIAVKLHRKDKDVVHDILTNKRRGSWVTPER